MKLDVDRLELAYAGVSIVMDRLDALERRHSRADDFNEADHPRAPDGKFTSGAGGGKAGAAAAEYQASLKGKKGSVAGLIKHLIGKGDVHEGDIFDQAQALYGLTDDKKGYVKWYHADMKKKGEQPPDLLKGKAPKDEPEVAAKAQEKTAASEDPTALPADHTFVMKQLKGEFDQQTPEEFIKFNEGVEYSNPVSTAYVKTLIAAAKDKLAAKTLTPGAAADKVSKQTLWDLQDLKAEAKAHGFNEDGAIGKKTKAIEEALALGTPQEVKDALDKIEPVFAYDSAPHQKLNDLIKNAQADAAEAVTAAGAKKDPTNPFAPGSEPAPAPAPGSGELPPVPDNLHGGLNAAATFAHGIATGKNNNYPGNDVVEQLENYKLSSHSGVHPYIDQLIEHANGQTPDASAAASQSHLADENIETKTHEWSLSGNDNVAKQAKAIQTALALPTTEAQYTALQQVPPGVGGSPASATMDKWVGELKAKYEAKHPNLKVTEPTGAPPAALATNHNQKYELMKDLTKYTQATNKMVKAKATGLHQALQQSTLADQAKAISNLHETSNNNSVGMQKILAHIKTLKAQYNDHLPGATPSSVMASTPKPEGNFFAGQYLHDIVTKPGTLNANKLGSLAHYTDPAKAYSSVTPETAAYAKQLIAHLGGEVVPTPPPPAPKTTPATPGHKLSTATSMEYATNSQHWGKALEANKPAIEAADTALQTALGHDTLEAQTAAVDALTPIANPTGMAQKSFNDHLAKVKQDYGLGVAKPVPTASLPKGPPPPVQDTIFHAAKKAPHSHTDNVTYLEDHSGKEVKSRLKANTKNIPGDHYAKVTAAYGNSTDAMLGSVDSAMQSYHNTIKNNYTGAQLQALKEYQNSDYTDTNNHLLGKNKGSPAIKERIKQISEAIATSYVPADTPVWRGLKADFQELTGFSDPQEAVGRSFEHKNFASCSRAIGTSKIFGDRTMLRFTVPAGTNGWVMGGQKDGEREIVLGTRSMFKVDRVEQIANSYGGVKHVIHCTYLGVREDD